MILAITINAMRLTRSGSSNNDEDDGDDDEDDDAPLALLLLWLLRRGMRSLGHHNDVLVIFFS